MHSTYVNVQIIVVQERDLFVYLITCVYVHVKKIFLPEFPKRQFEIKMKRYTIYSNGQIVRSDDLCKILY